MGAGRRSGSRWTSKVTALLGLVVVLIAAATGLTGCGVVEQGRSAPGADLAGPASAFLDAYVDPDGRVVRRDQAGDTVSEGQAYAMLVAVGAGDRTTFDRVWGWTSQHLLRPDGTLSWRWADGSVVDPASASDADLDAARALVLAGRVFGDLDLLADGVRLGQAVLDVETVDTSAGLVLTAGSWAATEPWAFNPSYGSPVAYAVLGEASGDPRWADLAAGSRAVTTRLLGAVDLPPGLGPGPRRRAGGPDAGRGRARRAGGPLRLRRHPRPAAAGRVVLARRPRAGGAAGDPARAEPGVGGRARPRWRSAHDGPVGRRPRRRGRRAGRRR